MNQWDFQRRKLLQGMGIGALGAAMGGCAGLATGQGSQGFQRPYSAKPLIAPKVSSANIINQIVGHRPYRPGGFVVRSEPFGDKTLVHNYGHGGGGITLSWGSSTLAVNEVKDSPLKQAAIIGSGVMGLTTARLLQDAGWQVTLYTKAMPQFTTSQVAGGEWGPYSVHDPKVSTEAFKLQLQQAAAIAHHTFSRMVGKDYGIEWKELYTLSETPPQGHDEFAQYYPFAYQYGPGKHPFAASYCSASATMLVETSTFLRRLVQDIRVAGGQFVFKTFTSHDELFGLSEPVIFNCTGLGSHQLFGDNEIMPAKGQLVLLPPDPTVDYLTVGGSEQPLYMFSRNDYMILGGTFRPGDWSTAPEPEQTERIIYEHQQLFARLI